jgi:hypothetical protein
MKDSEPSRTHRNVGGAESELQPQTQRWCPSRDRRANPEIGVEATVLTASGIVTGFEHKPPNEPNLSAKHRK